MDRIQFERRNVNENHKFCGIYLHKSVSSTCILKSNEDKSGCRLKMDRKESRKCNWKQSSDLCIFNKKLTSGMENWERNKIMNSIKRDNRISEEKSNLNDNEEIIGANETEMCIKEIKSDNKKSRFEFPCNIS